MSEMRHYVIQSPSYLDNSGSFGPEWATCYVELLASSKRGALIRAIRTDEFEEWANMQRGDGKSPFQNLMVELAVCGHGVCWGCGNICYDCCEEF